MTDRIEGEGKRAGGRGPGVWPCDRVSDGAVLGWGPAGGVGLGHRPADAYF